MKALIITQNEPFYIPKFLDIVLSKYENIIGIIILPGIPNGFTTVSYFNRLINVFGFKACIAYGTLLIKYKVLDLINALRKSSRCYSIRRIAKKNLISIYKLNDINAPESLKLIKALKPEIIISVASPQIFKRELIKLTPNTINVHAALLPQYKGMMPSFWVLAKGEQKTGITVHFMKDNLDSGDIILQKVIEISNHETFHSLQTKVAKYGAITLLDSLKIIEENKITTIPNGKGSYFSFPNKEAAKELKAKGHHFI